MMTFERACESASKCSENGCSVHVNAQVRLVPIGTKCRTYEHRPMIVGYSVSDWYCTDSTVVTYVNGQRRD
jgi:hypothetical protein